MINSLVYCHPIIIKDKKPRSHEIFLDEDTSFSIAEAGIPIGVFGQTNTGKTTGALIIASQTNCIYFDPQGRLKERLKEIGEDNNWKFYKITDNENARNRFTINAADLHPRVANIIAKTSRFKDRQVIKTISEFSNLPQSGKTYAGLKAVMEKKKLFEFLDGHLF